MLKPTLECKVSPETEYDPDLLTLRSDLLLLSLYLLLDERSITLEEIERGSILDELERMVSALISLTMKTQQQESNLLLAAEFPWDLSSLDKTWDSWEENGFVIVDVNTSEVSLTYAGLKRIQYLLESNVFSPLQQRMVISVESTSNSRRKLITSSSNRISLCSFITFLGTPPARNKNIFLVVVGYLSLLGLISLLVTMSPLPSDVFLITALALVTTLTFTVITSMVYQWIMALRTRHDFLWNNLERVVSSNFLTLLNLLFLGTAALYLIIHQLPALLSSSMLRLGVAVFSLIILAFLTAHQMFAVKRTFMYQRMFYQQLHEILSNAPFLESNNGFLSELVMKEVENSHFISTLTRKIERLTNGSLLGFIWQSSNYMVLYYLLMLAYIAFEGSFMLLGKYLLAMNDDPVSVHAMTALVGSILFLSIYYPVKFIFIHPSMTKKNFIPAFISRWKFEFFLRNILHDFLYALNAPAEYQEVRKKARRVVLRFFEIFVFFTTVAILSYDVIMSLLESNELVPVEVMNVLPSFFLIEGALFVIIYSLLGIISWITTVEIPLNDLDKLVNRVFKESPESFVEALFKHYVINPVIYHRTPFPTLKLLLTSTVRK